MCPYGVPRGCSPPVGALDARPPAGLQADAVGRQAGGQPHTGSLPPEAWQPLLSQIKGRGAAPALTLLTQGSKGAGRIAAAPAWARMRSRGLDRRFRAARQAVRFQAGAPLTERKGACPGGLMPCLTSGSLSHVLLLTPTLQQVVGRRSPQREDRDAGGHSRRRRRRADLRPIRGSLVRAHAGSPSLKRSAKA